MPGFGGLGVYTTIRFLGYRGIKGLLLMKTEGCRWWMCSNEDRFAVREIRPQRDDVVRKDYDGDGQGINTLC